MNNYQIKFDKKTCVGSGICASVSPENWKLVETADGLKAKPKKLIINEDEYDSNSQAADMCPVEAIILELTKKKSYGSSEDSFEDYEEEDLY
jgi:ferredoxin